MKSRTIAVLSVAMFAFALGTAEAKGHVVGATVGAAVGAKSHHAVAGAVVGGAVGHHMAKTKAKKQAKAAPQLKAVPAALAETHPTHALF